VVTDLLQTIDRQRLNMPIERFLAAAVQILIQSQVGIAIVGLGIGLGPRAYLILVDENGVLFEINDGRELFAYSLTPVS